MSILKISLAALAAGFIATSAAQAADLIVADPVVDLASPSTWEPYIGITGSIATDGTTYAGVGIVFGADVDLTDTVFIGAELRGTAYFNSVYLGAEGDIIGRLGFHAGDTVDLYALGGVGYFAAAAGGGNAVYTLGVGAEFDVAEDLAIRTEVAGSGAFGGGFTDAQATLGLLWKL